MVSNLLNKLAIATAKVEDKASKIDWKAKIEDAKLVTIGLIAVGQMEAKKALSSGAHKASEALEQLSKKCN